MLAPDHTAPAGRRPPAAWSAVLFFVLGALVSLGSAATAAAAEPGETPAELRTLEAQGIREIIVRRDASAPAAARADSRADVDATLVERGPLPDTEVLRVPAGRLDEAVAELRARSDVRWAEANGRVRAGAGDPYYLWSLSNDGRALNAVPGRVDADSDVFEAWNRSTGSGVAIAVVDSGVDTAHPDLTGRIAGNPGEQGDGREFNGRDDDGNGFADDASGWDWIDGDRSPADAHGHGTHVAGTIAALRGNGIGISGVAPDARVLPLRVLDASGAGWDSDVAAAFDYAGRLGVPVVNASLGGFGASPAEEDAIRRHPGTLFVVAAGNAGANVDASAHSPCTVPLPNVVCVGATDHADQPAGYSNYGATQVDLFAPGSLITSLAPGGGYARMSGTSMATPHVAGAAALALALEPASTVAELRGAVLGGAEPLPALAGRAATGARLNAVGALDRLDESVPAAPEKTPVPAPAPDLQPPPAPVSPQPQPQPQPAPAPVPPPGAAGPIIVAPQPPKPASPFQRLVVSVRGRQVTARVLVSRTARVRLSLRRGRAATASTRRLASGATTVRLGRLRPGRYSLQITAGAARITRAFTVR